MGTRDAHHRTLKEHLVIIHFANKTEKHYSTSGRETALHWVLTTEALTCKGVHASSRISMETEDNLFPSFVF